MKGTRTVRRPFVWLALVIALGGIAACIRFDVLATRDDVWVVDRHSNHICTLGFEAVEPPCWPAVAAGVAKLGLIRPNGGDWTMRATGLQEADARKPTGPCHDATVWYADNARNLFLSDGHAYAVNAPMPLPFRDNIRICALRQDPGRFAIEKDGTSAPAVQMR
jgi:hypothetical protein